MVHPNLEYASVWDPHTLLNIANKELQLDFATMSSKIHSSFTNMLSSLDLQPLLQARRALVKLNTFIK